MPKTKLDGKTICGIPPPIVSSSFDSSALAGASAGVVISGAGVVDLNGWLLIWSWINSDISFSFRSLLFVPNVSMYFF